MDALSLFALVILTVLTLCGIGAWAYLAILPGKIAAGRRHRQVDAVRICGYWGAVTLGLLMPVAFIWAYWDFGRAADDEQAGAAE